MLSPAPLIERAPFLRRIIPSLWKRYAKTMKHRYVIEERMGVLYLIDQKNSVDRNLLIKGAWEPQQVKALKGLVAKHRRPGQQTVFLDIGAHGALYSMILHNEKLVDRAICFEPEPTNLVQLKANLFINGLLDTIEVIDKAASDHEGEITFYSAIEGNRGGSRMTATETEILAGEVTVQAARMDQMVDLKDCFIVAKIDVEGSENTVLDGMPETMANNRGLYQIECFEEGVPALKERMASHGFTYVASIVHDHLFLKDA